MTPGSPAYLAAQRADLLRFAAGSQHDLGFGWLDDAGRLAPGRPVELWITSRMTHVFSLALLAGEPPAPGGPDAGRLTELAEHGVDALLTHLFDHEHHGWYAAVGPDGVVDERKQAYGHAFAVLAGCSAVQAEVEGADELLAVALAAQELHFWDDDEGMVVDAWDRAWTRPDDYRGVNGVMHTVEAYLAAADVTSEDPAGSVWYARAGRMVSRVLDRAEENDWRVPEHFDARWRPLLEHHRDEPAHPFQPYGATVGHGLEWARLALPFGLEQAATALADRAVADGWHADGADGFVYTTDWSGRPVVRSRFHWVLAEAVAAAEALHRVTDDPRWAEAAATWWAYADRHLVDAEHGSWRHELDERNRPAATVWPGKPDVYHAYQAALLPTLPRSTAIPPSIAGALVAPDRWD